MEGNKAVLKTFKILEVIATHNEGMTLSEIVKETKLPKSTVFDILEALYDEDAIFYKDYYRKTYVIGAKLFSIGQNYINHSNFISLGSPLLKQFADENKAICYLCKRNEDRIVYVHSYSPEGSRLISHSVGSNYKIDESIAGKVFLAFATKYEIDELMGMVSPAKLPQIKKQIETIRNNGYALETDTEFAAIHKIAIPVFNFENRVIGVACFNQLRSSKDGIELLIQKFRDIGREISKKQGYNKEY